MHNIVENPAVHMSSLDRDALWKAVTGGYQQSLRIARPLAYISFALNYLHGGLDVFGYHVVNIWIHFLTAVVLFLLIRLITQLPRLAPVYGSCADAIALLSAVFWALHPLNVTAVTYIVQRMASMAALFYLLALYCYLKGRLTASHRQKILLFAAGVGAGLSGFASKENVVMLPISILALEFYLIQPVEARVPKWLKRLAIVVVGLFVIFGLFKLTAGELLSGYERRSFTLLERLLTQPRLLIFYLGLFLYPTGSRLMLLHDPIVSTGFLTPWTTLPALLAVGAGLAFGVAMRRRFPLASFGLLFFLLNHLVESSILPLEMIYEHRNYLPMVFLSPLVAVGLLKVLGYFQHSRIVRPLSILLVAFLIGANGFGTYLYNEVLRTNLGLWLNNAAKTPRLSVVQNNLGNVLLDMGMTEDALPILEQALAYDRFNNPSQKAVVHYNLGRAYERIYGLSHGKTLDAYQAALKVNPQHIKSLNKLALYHQLEGRFEKAEELLLGAAPLRPGMAEIQWRNSLSLAQLKLGKAEAAHANASVVLAARPNAVPPRAVIAEVHRRQGRLKFAIHGWESVLRTQPENLDALMALTELYYRIGGVEKAAPMVRRTMGARSNNTLEEIIVEQKSLDPVSAWTHDYVLLRSVYQAFSQTQLMASEQ